MKFKSVNKLLYNFLSSSRAFSECKTDLERVQFVSKLKHIYEFFDEHLPPSDKVSEGRTVEQKLTKQHTQPFSIFTLCKFLRFLPEKFKERKKKSQVELDCGNVQVTRVSGKVTVILPHCTLGQAIVFLLCRVEGNNHFKRKEDDEALAAYSKSALYAEPGSM